MIPAHETKDGDLYGIVRVSPEFFEMILSHGNEAHFRVTHGLPPGARIVGTRQSHLAGWIELLVAGVKGGQHSIEHERTYCAKEAA